MIGLVVPRPIALVTSVSRAGVVNTAPYSFFNMFSENPAVVVIGIDARPDGSMKDSAKNARDTGVFVVYLVDEGLAAAMNDCAVDFPPETSETGMLGLPLAAGIHVSVPHLVDDPAALECRKMIMINIGPDRELLVGVGCASISTLTSRSAVLQVRSTPASAIASSSNGRALRNGLVGPAVPARIRFALFALPAPCRSPSQPQLGLDRSPVPRALPRAVRDGAPFPRSPL